MFSYSCPPFLTGGKTTDKGLKYEANVSVTSSPTKARDFEGPGGPETKQAIYEEANPGNDDVRENVRQGGETRRPGGG